MKRPHVSVFIATSLDGYIARADGSIDFLDCVQAPGEDYGFARFFAAIDTLVMGRHTWDVAAAFPEWPYAGKRVVVLTHRALDACHGEETHAGDLAPLFARLQEAGARRIYLDGGNAIRQALAANLVDDMTISTVPVLLGDGIPLFTQGVPASTWDLVDARGYASGLVQATWKARDLPPA